MSRYDYGNVPTEYRPRRRVGAVRLLTRRAVEDAHVSLTDQIWREMWDEVAAFVAREGLALPDELWQEVTYLKEDPARPYEYLPTYEPADEEDYDAVWFTVWADIEG